MHILLAGGTGFIGSHILMKLIEEGHTVEVLARNPDKIPSLRGINGITVTKGDVTDPAAVEKAVTGKDACVYVALNYNDQNASAMLRADTLTTIFCADAAARAGVRQFIYTSSASANDYVYKTETPRIEGGKMNNVFENTKQNPVSYYGAGKAATENFLNAISYQTPMKVNVVRPGFTFAEPAVEGGPLYADKRFGSIIRSVKEGKDVELIKNDGTQFIWAGHLAEVYAAILGSCVNHKTYISLSTNFVTWEQIAREAIRMCNSKSNVTLEDRGWSDDVILFDVSAIKRDFNLEFNSWEKLKQHIAFYLAKS